MAPLTPRLGEFLLLSIIAHVLVFQQFGAARSLPGILPSRVLQVRLETGVAPPPADAVPDQQPEAPPRPDQAAEPPVEEQAIAAADPEDVEPSPVVLPVEEIYHKSSELDVQPRPLTEVDLVYTPEQLVNGLHGWVKLLLLLDEKGRVRRAEVLESDPPNVFDDGALAAFRAAPFEPGQIDGEPVKSRMVVKVSFSLVGSGNQIMPRR